jgi:phage replication-related protein YjqB (UPF0714/DUF867 family)
VADRTAELDQITAEFREALDTYIDIYQRMIEVGGSPEEAQAALAAKLLDWGFNADGLSGLLVAAISRLAAAEKG